MNYRHAFHAGNHCDVLKHAALTLVLGRLAAKEKPFMVLDTHGGRGLYDLDSEAASRSGEHLAGIARIFGAADAPPPLEPYFEAIRRQNPFGGMRWYPGSPILIREALRPGDSAKFCELHPEERAALTAALEGDRQARVFDRDGYQAVRAFLPPVERRGLVLIDPPFEQPGEYDRLAEAVSDGLKRWASGVFMIWRPIKDETGYRRFASAVADAGAAKTMTVTLSVAARVENKLTGSGLFIINPPFGLGDALAEILPWLAARLAAAPGGGWSLVETENRKMLRNESGTA